MKMLDFISNEKRSLSFEVFPPKTDAAFDGVLQATEEIAELKPSFISVTYGAGGTGENIPGRSPAGCRTRTAWKRWPT